MKPTHLSRRTVLRGLLGGAAVSVALPLLEAMLNKQGTALASGAPLPKRLGVFFWGVGCFPEAWRPTGAGRDWQPGATLAPLAPVKDYVSVFSNLNFPEKAGDVVHYRGQGYMLTGSYSTNPAGDEGFGAPGGPSLDQIAAAAWKGQTSTPAIVVAVARRTQGDGAPVNQVSWVGENRANYHEYSLGALYQKLFGTLPTAATRSRAARRKSILDTVLQDYQALNARLGVDDRARLARHADALRDIEMSVTRFSDQVCTAPAVVADVEGPLNREPLTERSRLFADMLAVALSCDLTRTFAIQFTAREANTVLWQVGATDGLHEGMSHHPDVNNNRALLQKYYEYTMGEFSYLLQKFKATADGAGNLLDNSAIYATSCIADPTLHTYGTGVPQLLVGKAGGALRSGIHYISGGNESTSRVPLTALRAVGIDATSFGSGAGLETQAIDSLLV